MMRSVILACLLVVAGVSALPQELDVAPSQGRFVDLVLLDLIRQYENWIKENEMDPFKMENYEFDDTIINDLIHLRGYAKNMKLKGHGKITTNRMEYSILLGRLDFDVSIDKITFSVGEYKADMRYGNFGGTGILSGDIEIENIRIRGDALLLVYPGSPVTILNINTRLTIDDIRSNFTASWQGLGSWEPTDYSSELNEIFNVLMPGWLDTFEREIGTIVGELIRHFVNWYWPHPV